MKFRKLFSTGMAGLMALSALTACQNNQGTTGTSGIKATDAGKTEASDTTQNKTSEVVKPQKIKMMVNGNLLTKVNARDEWEKQWEEYMGIDLDITQPDHDAYLDSLGTTIASGQWPDVVFLQAASYGSYANEGVLWDMTEAFENSELKKSGRIISQDVFDAVKVDGKLYGMPNNRGTGCITYIKKKWLDNVGLNVPTNFDEYMKVIEAFTKEDPDGNGVKGDTFGVTAAGLIGKEVPYTNYLPEFYQDAFPYFYKAEDGSWKDGFEEPAMEQALSRLKDAYTKGYMEKQTLDNGTKDCRNKFLENKFGVFTYWAGKWNTNLKTSLEANGLDGELIAIPPIQGVNAYVEKTPNVWAITSKAENPEGIFKYFMESMLDGDKVQTLWTYGVKGIHWNDKAETVLGKAYKEGEFHMLESLEIPGTLYTTAHIDPALPVASFVNGDPGEKVVAPEARASRKIFDEHAVSDVMVPVTAEYSENNADLVSLKNEIIAAVVTQGKDYKTEMERYVKEGGREKSELILKSLNAKNAK